MSERFAGSFTVAQDEQPPFGLDWRNIGTPTSVTAKLYEMSSHADVTAAGLSGSPSVNGTVVTLPAVVGSALVVNSTYQLICRAMVNGMPLSVYLVIKTEY